jgi:hypothetical protein
MLTNFFEANCVTPPLRLKLIRLGKTSMDLEANDPYDGYIAVESEFKVNIQTLIMLKIQKKIF